MVHAVVAPGKLEKEEPARTIQPRFRLGTVHVKAAAVRTAIQSNPAHDNTAES
jgi:hypothetical protein